MKKSTVYIDIEDDITAIISKIEAAREKLVVLVLPKRATTLQSIVNMRLVRQAAESSSKNIVLVTTEATLLPLAGMAGLSVAKSLSSKPAIPEVPNFDSTSEEIADQELVVSEQQTAVGALAEQAEADETIDLPADEESKDSKVGKTEGKKKLLRVPDFDIFRNRIFLGAGIFLLVVLAWFFGFVVMPKAHIVVRTQTSGAVTEFPLTARVNTQTADIANAVVPAEVKEVKKTEVEKFTPTGEKNIGNKASGTVTFTNCTDNPVTIASGTSISNSSYVFIVGSNVSLDSGDFTSGGVCKSSGPHVKSTTVTAQNAGDNYNLSARSYTISGISGDVRAQGGAMSGGTTKIAKVVKQSDVDGAKDKILARANQEMKAQMQQQLEAAGLVAVPESFQATQSDIRVSPAVDQEAVEGQATIEFSYSMFGLNKAATEALLAEKIKPFYDASKQTVVSNGLDKATMTVSSRQSGELVLNYKSEALIGPILDANEITNLVLGKRLGEAEKILKERPGISGTDIKLEPFWVFSVPKSAKKVTISFEAEPQSSTNSTETTTEENATEP